MCYLRKLLNRFFSLYLHSLDKLNELSDVNEQLKDIIKTKDQKLALLQER